MAVARKEEMKRLTMLARLVRSPPDVDWFLLQERRGTSQVVSEGLRQSFLRKRGVRTLRGGT